MICFLHSSVISSTCLYSEYARINYFYIFFFHTFNLLLLLNVLFFSKVFLSTYYCHSTTQCHSLYSPWAHPCKYCTSFYWHMHLTLSLWIVGYYFLLTFFHLTQQGDSSTTRKWSDSTLPSHSQIFCLICCLQL